jgi:glycosyltransferase involved in cell wall biosynthesis
LARRLNRVLLSLQLRWVLRKLPAHRQLWSFTPDVADVLGKFGEKERVYYCVDEFAAFPGYDVETIAALDKRMCESSDLVITTSGTLFEKKRAMNPEATIYVPHGVLYDRFSPAVAADYPEAADVRHLPRPRVGFFGLIHEWWDLELIAEIAVRRPDWSFIFVGQTDTDVSRFAALPNMHFVGQRPHEALPSYCRSFDVAVIPHKINELTRSMNPIKLLEYLAAGLPIVSSRLPEAVLYAPHVQCAEGVDEWISALSAAIADRGAESDRRRSQRASTEDWSVRVATILDALEQVGSKAKAVPSSTQLADATRGTA